MKVSQPLPVTLPPYGVLFAESVHATDFRMAERADPFHKLIYVLDGAVGYRERRKSAAAPAEAGTVLVVPRDVRHQIADVRPSTLLLLCLADGYLAADADLPRLWLELARQPGRRVHPDRPARIRLENMWRRAMLELAHARVGGAVSVRTLAAQILVLLARLPARETGNAAAQRVAAVAREIGETFYDEWSLERAAGRAGLSRRRFSELFRAVIGCSFWEHLNAQRLTHAARLLQAGEHSILGVMFSCGYNDTTHFYRSFRARYGAPPRAWLARNRAAGPRPPR
ncbi:MAG: helix-turn-helix transcriptional regulator [Opitutae bacterium]|nr:helix-turn-helix transcriptional regulator [Opitutae bacterium]